MLIRWVQRTEKQKIILPKIYGKRYNLIYTKLDYTPTKYPRDYNKMNELFEGRYFSTPKKMGAQTAEANINAGIAAAQQIVDYLENGVTKFQVNK